VNSRGNRKKISATSSAKEKIRAAHYLGCFEQRSTRRGPDTDYAAILPEPSPSLRCTSTPRTQNRINHLSHWAAPIEAAFGG